MFSLTLFIIKNVIQTCDLFFGRPVYYHSTNKTQVTDSIFKLTRIHALWCIHTCDFLNYCVNLNFLREQFLCSHLLCVVLFWVRLRGLIITDFPLFTCPKFSSECSHMPLLLFVLCRHQNVCMVPSLDVAFI